MNEHSKERTREGFQVAIYAIGISMSLLVLYYAYSMFLVRDRHANFVLGLSLGLFYLVQARDYLDPAGDEPDDPTAESTALEWAPKPIRELRSRIVAAKNWSRSQIGDRYSNVFDVVVPLWFTGLAILALASMLYIDLNYTRLSERAIITGFTGLDYLIGGLVILLCIDVTRRAFGNILGGVIALSVVYGLAGPYLPGLLYHGGMSLRQVIRIGVLSMGGVLGFILEIGSTWIAVFLLLAGFAKAYGVLDWVVEASQELGKLTQSGIVHVAIISSMLMGMITGSGAANTATTGSFTIPMMKKQGVSNAHAGAIEAVASIGGQLVPPIMGVAAFIMADLIGVPYVEIVKAGLIPAFLFYFSIVVSVQLILYKHGWTTTVSRDLDWSVFTDLAFYVVPFAVLVYYLIIRQFTPLTAGLYTVGSLIGVFVVKSVYEHRATGIVSASKRTAVGLKTGAKDMAPLMAILGSIGVAIAMFVRTGFAQKLATVMVGLSGQNVLLLLVLAMIVSLVFGMGMPAPAAYILTASLAATAMTQFGIRDINAHMFVFYFAMYASLTPPVGPSTIVGARIAEASFITTGKKAMQIAAPGFLVPYVFIVNDSLLTWTWPGTLVMFVVATVSMVGICVAISGFDGRSRVALPQRFAYLGLALVALFAPQLRVLPLSRYQTVQFISAGLLLLGVVYFRGSRGIWISRSHLTK